MFYKFKTKPYGHQLIALEKSSNKKVYALFMEMGTGKTKVAIDNLAMLYDKGKVNGALIIAPKGVYKNWYSQEVEDFAHAHFEFSSGVSGWMDSSWSVRHHRLLEITININAANGNLTVTDDDVKLFLIRISTATRLGGLILINRNSSKGLNLTLGGRNTQSRTEHSSMR